jgi:hypothetical protein
MMASEAEGIGLLINQLAHQEKELAAQEKELGAARALLWECRAHIKDAGHLSPSCEHFGACELNSCGMDYLLRRIDAELGEE